MGLIYLDACLLIYLVEDHARWREPIAAAMARAGASRFAVSSLVKCECLVGPLKHGDTFLENAYRQMFERFVSLEMPELVFLQAARLRARFGLKTPDALHLACAQHHRCDALWTNDNRLAESSHGLARNVIGARRTAKSKR